MLVILKDNNNYNNNSRTFILRIKMQSELRGASKVIYICTLAGRMTSVMCHIASTFPLARQGTILSNHRVIGIATNTSMMLSCALVSNLMMTAEVELPDEVYVSVG